MHENVTEDAAGFEEPEGTGCFPTSGSAGDVYLEHAPVLRRVAIRKFGVPPADVDGLIHDVFVNCLLAARNVTDLRAYLIGAICNASRNYWRSRRSDARVFAEAPRPVEEVAAMDSVFDGLAVNWVVATTLAQLDSCCRETLRRYYLDGEDTATIAEAMNTTPSNVNYRMHVCRKRARAIYERLTRVRPDV